MALRCPQGAALLLLVAVLHAAPALAACPSGWYQAVGTVYDSWPQPRSKECVDYSGCEWAGMFASKDAGSNNKCSAPAQWLNGGNGDFNCRYPDCIVNAWSVAATFGRTSGAPSILGRQIEVMVEGKTTATARVNVIDQCGDDDCDNCCSINTGSGKWTLIDMEKWPASRLLGFNPTAPGFDINDVATPPAGGSRPGAGSGVMALCFRDVGAETTGSINTCNGGGRTCAAITATVANGAWPAGACNGAASGASCTAICKTGFTGSPKATCTNGAWSAVSGSCTAAPRTCAAITATVANGAWPFGACNGAASGATCPATCKTGFTGSPKATCTNGAWSAVSGSCTKSGGTCSGPSTDGTCGTQGGKKCCASGSCCSQYGWCSDRPNDPAYCGTGCQVGYGSCAPKSAVATMMSDVVGRLPTNGTAPATKKALRKARRAARRAARNAAAAQQGAATAVATADSAAIVAATAEPAAPATPEPLAAPATAESAALLSPADSPAPDAPAASPAPAAEPSGPPPAPASNTTATEPAPSALPAEPPSPNPADSPAPASDAPAP